MTRDEFKTFIASIEAAFVPTIDELKQAVRDAGAAYARELKADMGKPRPGWIAATQGTRDETTRQAYDRCVTALKARVEGYENVGQYLAHEAKRAADAAANSVCVSRTVGMAQTAVATGLSAAKGGEA